MTHPEENLGEIRASLEAHGQVKPVVYWCEEGKPRIIAGNGTFRVAKSLGWGRLAMTEYVGTREEAMAYALADNHTAELARWDIAKRDLQLAALGLRWEPIKVDWKPVAAKFDAPAPSPRSTEPRTSHTKTEQRAPSRVSAGDLWVLGRHKVLCAPSIDSNALWTLTSGEHLTLRYVTVAPDREPRWWSDPGLTTSWSPYWPGWEPLRQALGGEVAKANWSIDDVCRLVHDGRAGRWFNPGPSWEVIPRDAYEVLQKAGSEQNVFAYPYEVFRAMVTKLDENKDRDFAYLETLFAAAGATNPVRILVLGSALPASLVAAEHTGSCCFGALPAAETCDLAISFWETQTGLTAEKA